jgi:hypothetical protein
MTAVFLASWMALLEIQGDVTCPTAAEVSQHLTKLVPESAAPSSAPAPHALLSAGPGFVGVALLSANGDLLADRRLDSSGSCSDLAEAVAVVLAAWHAKLSPAVAVPVVTPPPAPVELVAASPPKVESPRPLAFDVGIAVLAAIVVGGDATFGAKLEGTLNPFRIPVGAHLALSMSSTHTTHAETASSLPVEARWLRPALAIGPNLRLGQTLMLDLHVDGVLALLHVEGAGLDAPSSDTGVQFGFAAGLRGLWRWQSGTVWLGVDFLDYPARDRLTVGNYEVGRLPHLEVQVALGIALGRFR